ncbi:MAG: B12-binding domain-containing radical SAM protein, partial [Promethearchaeota archaeon]
MTFKILLIRPFSMTGKMFGQVSGPMPPLNLAYIAGYLRDRARRDRRDFLVEILDLEIEKAGIKAFKKKLRSFKPDLVGFTVHTNNFPIVKRLAKHAKDLFTDTIIVVGGPHPTTVPESTLRECKDIDFIIHGEGEKTFFELVSQLSGDGSTIDSIPGIYYRIEGDKAIKFTGPRPLLSKNELKITPARDLLDYEKYLAFPQSPGVWKKTANIFSQRGCPYNCTFCASPVIHRKQVRFFPIKHVIQEIKHLKEKYGVCHVNFRDSNFTLNRKRCIKLCNEMIKSKISLTWNCETRVNLVDNKLLRLMKMAGCIKISFGVESGSQRILNRINKHITIADI